jgi:hypothetical protein
MVCLVGSNDDSDVPASSGRPRITRHELYREFAYPPPGAPRYCTIYETTDGQLTPEDTDTVLFRLVYRRIPPPD